MLPKMEEFDFKRYHTLNPICPHLTYECIRRIFGRSDHSCLSSANKPKAVEVVLKFVKLHDGFNFADKEQVLSYFDHYIEMDFLKYENRKNPLDEMTISTIVDAYNATPGNFQNPPDSVINDVINVVDQQMALDQKAESEDGFFYTDNSEEESPMPTSMKSNEEQTIASIIQDAALTH